MIQAVIFDLDGTLVQTEVLKAKSYAKATQILTKNSVSETMVLEVFQNYVGLSREKVLEGLVHDFELELKESLETEDVDNIASQLIEKRLALYEEMLNNEDLLSKQFCPYSLALFHKLREDGFKLVLATMSHLKQAQQVTTMMGIYEKFDFVLTKDDVEEGKPAPEIYEKARLKLGLTADECLVIEDSVNGIKAAQHAKMHVFAVTNDVTRKSVHDCKLLPPTFVVDNLTELTTRVYDFINESKSIGK
ncbi:MAG: HAD family phosphatase [Bacteroidota bacterium]